MRTADLVTWLNDRYPSAVAEEWDNPGLIVGEMDQEVNKIMTALDATEEVVAQAVAQEVDMLITHHPMIFGKIRKVNDTTILGRKIITLIKHNISYFAMHTNYDILGMNQLMIKYLELENVRALEAGKEPETSLGCVGDLRREMTLREFAQFVKNSLKLESVRIYGEPDTKIRCVAACTGSGKSLMEDVIRSGAQVYVTGDIDHHTGLDAVEMGLSIIDAGHYGTEYIFAESIKEELTGSFPELEIVSAEMRCPYITI